LSMAPPIRVRRVRRRPPRMRIREARARGGPVGGRLMGWGGEVGGEGCTGGHCEGCLLGWVPWAWDMLVCAEGHWCYMCD